MNADSNASVAASSGSTLSCHDVRYVVKVGNRCRKTTDKEILKGITGVFEPGMNAILGPTGSGKTSLLDILAGRKDKSDVKGEVLIDGNELPSNFKCCSGYVVQDDVVMGTLTVRENLAFSAALRLPTSISNAEKRGRVDEIINELGLNGCKDTKLGTDFLRGVSGGERKRTNIGMELIIHPSVLFLDEPTTGLDANTAFTVMNKLALLAKRGRCIIFSIHQPRYTIYQLFDKLHLLSQGQTVYNGPAREALDYFSSIGYECEAHNNPPDFFLDIIIQSENSAVAPPTPEHNSQSALQMEEGKGQAMESVAAPAAGSSLVERYRQSRYHREAGERSAEILKVLSGGSAETAVTQYTGYATGFFTQVAIVSRRAFLNYRRNIQISIVQPVMTIFFALIMGFVYFDVDDTFPAGTQNRTGAFFFASIFMIFSNLAAMELFIKERTVFIHESSNGFYRTSSFFIAKMICDLLPMRILPTVTFGVIYYWMIGFRPEAGAFFIFLFTLLLATFCGTALIYLISIKFGIISVATAIATAINILMFVFGGVIVNTSSIPDWLEWIKYFSVIRYSVNALSINEFRGLVFCRKNTTICITGEMYLEDLNIDHSNWGLWQNHVALACIMVLVFALGLIQLIRVPKYK